MAWGRDLFYFSLQIDFQLYQDHFFPTTPKFYFLLKNQSSRHGWLSLYMLLCSIGQDRIGYTLFLGNNSKFSWLSIIKLFFFPLVGHWRCKRCVGATVLHEIKCLHYWEYSLSRKRDQFLVVWVTLRGKASPFHTSVVFTTFFYDIIIFLSHYLDTFLPY